MFRQEASSKADLSVSFVDVAKVQSEAHVRSNAQIDARIDGRVVGSSFTSSCRGLWGADLGIEKISVI